MFRLRGAASALAVASAVALGACGDSDTNDGRGYTKAPLENPGVRITAEPTTPMGRLGEPVLPAVVDPDELGGAQQGAAAGS